jgi:hypothetical protein
LKLEFCEKGSEVEDIGLNPKIQLPNNQVSYFLAFLSACLAVQLINNGPTNSTIAITKYAVFGTLLNLAKLSNLPRPPAATNPERI